MANLSIIGVVRGARDDNNMAVVEELMLMGSVGCQVSVLTHVGSWMFFSWEIFWSTWSFGRGDFREFGGS